MIDFIQNTLFNSFRFIREFDGYLERMATLTAENLAETGDFRPEYRLAAHTLQEIFARTVEVFANQTGNPVSVMEMFRQELMDVLEQIREIVYAESKTVLESEPINAHQYLLELMLKEADYIETVVNLLIHPEFMLFPSISGWLERQADVRERAIKGDVSVLSELLSCVHNPWAEIRCESATLLSHYRQEPVITVLTGLLSDPEEAVSRTAAFSLEAIKNRRPKL